MHLQGVIFDFNGTLFWDTDKQEAAWRVFSKQLRGYPLSEEEMRYQIHGRPNKAALEYLTGCRLAEAVAGKLSQEKEHIYREMCRQDWANFKLAPGAIELLEYMQTNLIPFTIATASEITNVKFFFQELALDKWFVFESVVYDDGAMPGKPAPDIYIKAAAKLGLAPQDCIVVEDAVSGIEAAYRAEVGKVIAIGPAEHHAGFKKHTGVTEVITDFTDFAARFLNNQFAVS